MGHLACLGATQIPKAPPEVGTDTTNVLSITTELSLGRHTRALHVWTCQGAAENGSAGMWRKIVVLSSADRFNDGISHIGRGCSSAQSRSGRVTLEGTYLEATTLEAPISPSSPHHHLLLTSPSDSPTAALRIHEPLIASGNSLFSPGV